MKLVLSFYYYLLKQFGWRVDLHKYFPFLKSMLICVNIIYRSSLLININAVIEHVYEKLNYPLNANSSF